MNLEEVHEIKEQVKADLADDDLDDMEKYASLVPIFGAAEAVFDAWEQAVRDLETETEPDKWTKKLNRVEVRNAMRGKGDPQPQRSRIRRRVNRVARQKGWYK